MSDFCGFVVALLIFAIPIWFIMLIISLVKRKKVKLLLVLLLSDFVLIIMFTIIGTYSWSKTEEFQQVLLEREEQKSKESKEEIVVAETIDEQASIEIVESVEAKTELVEEDNTIEEVKIETTEIYSEVEVVNAEIELTEEEYKNQCREIYYDDIFSDELTLGEKVKIHVFIAEKYRYSFSDMMGIIVEDIAKQYNLLKECIGACAMHEETKDDTIPSYFGKQFYLMFIEDSELSIDNYKTGQYFFVYGEVIKTDNGVFVLPKYIEEEK